MGPVSTAYLTEFFVKKKGSISVVMESEMSIENLQNNNIIYVGPFRTMDVFSDLFLSESGKFSYDGKNIVDTETNQQIKDTHINQSRLDHVMVSFKQLTDKGHYIIFFAGNNDIGVQAAVKNFTNKKWLKEFYTHIPHKNSQFNALFTVKGIGRTELECELEKVEILKQ